MLELDGHFGPISLHLFHFGDIGGDLQFYVSTIDPFDGAVIVDIPFPGDRIFAFPDDDTGWLTVLVEQPMVFTMLTRLVGTAEGFITAVSFKVSAELLLHMLVHEKNLIGVQV